MAENSAPMPTPPILEICVDTPAGIGAAVAGGADRLELCSALSCGGLTPSRGLIRQALKTNLPVMVLIRPRAGGFVFTRDEVDVMLDDIAIARDAGVAGVVLGASYSDGSLDADVLSRLVNAAAGLDLTLHRAFDLVPNVSEALEVAVDLGFARILTSGGKPTLTEGVTQLISLLPAAAGRICLMPGGGLTPAVMATLWSLGCREFHASCRRPTVCDPQLRALGFEAEEAKETSADLVRSFKEKLVP